MRKVVPPTVLELLPDQLWAIIVLVDALDRCPWSNFPSRLGWHLPTYLVLAGALIHGAYVYSLVTSRLVADDKLAPPQREMFEVVRHRHPGYILGRTPEEQYEEKVFERLRDVLRCELPDGPDNPLRRAAKSFFALEPYKALCDLAEEGLLF